MITTKCKFYYGHTITESNQYIDFKEGAGSEIFATVPIGEYSLTDFCTAVSNALNLAGALNYTVSLNRTTRIITIAADGAFTLLASTGTRVNVSAYSLLGFSADTTSATSHTATSASGSVWEPQFLPQDFVDFENNQMAVDGSTKQSASGKVEAVKYGTKKLMECNFKFITDIFQGSKSPIANAATGVSDARTFLEYAVTKADLEFIPDVSDASVFTKCILDSTEADQNGLGFKLKELYSQGLVGYYETGLLKFRQIT